jgi:hypothetical protein
MKTGIVAVIIFVLSLVSCENGSGSSERLSLFDITDAKSLFIAPGRSSRSRAESEESAENKLFKITETGYVQEVSYFDDSGKSITSVRHPYNIVALNEDFILIGFSENEYGSVLDTYPLGGDPTDDIYLVNVHTGAAYIYSSIEQINTTNLPSKIEDIKTSIKADKIDNVYFLSDEYQSAHPEKLKKLSLGNADSVTVELWSVSTDRVWSFGVDGAGNVAYSATNDSGEWVYRYKKVSGDLVSPFFGSSLSVYVSLSLFWQGFQGELFFLDGSQIKKLQADPYEAKDYGAAIFGEFTQITRLKTKNKIIALGGAVYELYNTSSNPRAIPLSNFNLASAKLLASSNNFYYLVGKDMTTNKEVLVKINPEDDSHTTLLNGEVYAEIYKLVVSAQDVVTFNALKMPSGSVVLATIDKDGTIEELETFESKLTVLERIN